MRQALAILQAEYQQHRTSMQVLSDYYASLEKRKLPKCEIPQIDLILEGLNPSETIGKLCDKIMQTAEEEKVENCSERQEGRVKSRKNRN